MNNLTEVYLYNLAKGMKIMQNSLNKYKDLGWANSWGGYNTKLTPNEVKNCINSNHIRTDSDIGPLNRGIDHVVTCEICKIKWHYDSSD